MFIPNNTNCNRNLETNAKRWVGVKFRIQELVVFQLMVRRDCLQMIAPLPVLYKKQRTLQFAGEYIYNLNQALMKIRYL